MKEIEIFNNIRDIPYSIPLSDTEKNHSCSGKVIMLKDQLESLGYTSRYQVCEFLWSDLPLGQEVLVVPHEDLSTHVYLEVLIEENWIAVDPTWDSALKNIFSIAEWNGKTSTPIAVKPTKLFSHEESQRIMEDSDTEEIKRDREVNGEFYQALNSWLESQRI